MIRHKEFKANKDITNVFSTIEISILGFQKLVETCFFSWPIQQRIERTISKKKLEVEFVKLKREYVLKDYDLF
jgi:hypothetical protein